VLLQACGMSVSSEFRFVAIESFVDMRVYDGIAGQSKLAREARYRREINERMIAERAARGEVYAPQYVIDYAANERFWHEHFARIGMQPLRYRAA
jgi:hypothetical protein